MLRKGMATRSRDPGARIWISFVFLNTSRHEAVKHMCEYERGFSDSVYSAHSRSHLPPSAIRATRQRLSSQQRSKILYSISVHAACTTAPLEA